MRRLRDDRSDHREVQIAEVGFRVDAEVVVADVAPADHGDGGIRDHDLVVHAPVDAPKARDEVEPVVLTTGERIEHP